MTVHILLTKATRRPYSDVPEMPEKSSYNHQKGLWMIDGEPFANSSDFIETPTKKCDQETGEDQKGE